MLDKAVHAIMPGLVVVAAVVLVALRRIDSSTGVTMILSAGGYGAFAVAAAPKAKRTAGVPVPPAVQPGPIIPPHQ